MMMANRGEYLSCLGRVSGVRICSVLLTIVSYVQSTITYGSLSEPVDMNTKYSIQNVSSRTNGNCILGENFVDKTEKTLYLSENPLHRTISAVNRSGEAIAQYTHTVALSLLATGSYGSESIVLGLEGTSGPIIKLSAVAGVYAFSLSKLSAPIASGTMIITSYQELNEILYVFSNIVMDIRISKYSMMTNSVQMTAPSLISQVVHAIPMRRVPNIHLIADGMSPRIMIMSNSNLIILKFNNLYNSQKALMMAEDKINKQVHLVGSLNIVMKYSLDDTTLPQLPMLQSKVLPIISPTSTQWIASNTSYSRATPPPAYI